MATKRDDARLTHTSFIKVALGNGIEIRAKKRELPETEDPMDVECPQCHAKHWHVHFDIVQHGFINDLDAVVMRCEVCDYDAFVVLEIPTEDFYGNTA